MTTFLSSNLILAIGALWFLGVNTQASGLSECERILLLRNQSTVERVLERVGDRIPSRTQVVAFHGIMREELFELMKTGHLPSWQFESHFPIAPFDIIAATDFLPRGIKISEADFPGLSSLDEVLSAYPDEQQSFSESCAQAASAAQASEMRAFTLRFFNRPLNPENYSATFGASFLIQPEELVSNNTVDQLRRLFGLEAAPLPATNLDEYHKDIHELKTSLKKSFNMSEDQWRSLSREMDIYAWLSALCRHAYI